MKILGIKRIYDPICEEDGYRILVDRLWPRGVSKKEATLDEWDRTIAPSSQLRKWFDHKQEKFEEFEIKYKEELLNKTEDLNRIRKIATREHVTLLFAAKDETINHAVVLETILNKKI